MMFEPAKPLEAGCKAMFVDTWLCPTACAENNVRWQRSTNESATRSLGRTVLVLALDSPKCDCCVVVDYYVDPQGQEHDGTVAATYRGNLMRIDPDAEARREIRAETPRSVNA